MGDTITAEEPAAMNGVKRGALSGSLAVEKPVEFAEH